METFFAMGYDVGALVMGSLFYAIGTQKTLFIYSISAAVMLTILHLYVRHSKNATYYEKLQQYSEDEDE